VGITVGLTLGLATCLLALFAVYVVMRGRVERARAGERLAAERRERFFSAAAKELDAPLKALREHAHGSSLVGEIDEMRELVRELGRVPAPVDATERVDVDLAELIREIVSEPPFSDQGPSVILRASSTVVPADRARLQNGLRVLLWVARRDVSPDQSLVVTVSSDDETAYVEVDTGGAGERADALERLPAFRFGISPPGGPPGTTLALEVASKVARAHGGRLSASSRVGQGERFVLALPRATSAQAG
jgi:sigma-B regulation protein RsbU (phosphoserine phosphatase)